jgi:hypothetical protein
MKSEGNSTLPVSPSSTGRQLTSPSRTRISASSQRGAGWTSPLSIQPSSFDVHSDLAAALGAACGGDGCVLVDAHQRTTIPGLYAAGDVVLDLDQISHAMGEAGIAATTVRNDLSRRIRLLC